MSRVLLVLLSAMGDFVQSLGAMTALHAARPDLELHGVTQNELQPLAAATPGIRSVIGHDRRSGFRGMLRTARRLRALRCDTALDLQGNAKSAVLAWSSRARTRIGAAARWRQEPWSRVLLTRTVDVPGPRHPALTALAVVRSLAPEARAELPRLAATEVEIEEIAAVVRGLGLSPDVPFRVVVVARPDDPRAQRPEAVGRELSGAPRPVLALLGPDEGEADPSGGVLPKGVPVLRQSRGQLRQLVALGALVARSGGDVVSPDIGPAHVLAAAGARTTVLFGPQDPERTAPPAARVLRHPSPPPCVPCRRRRCNHELGPICMGFTSVEGREAEGLRWLRGQGS